MGNVGFTVWSNPEREEILKKFEDLRWKDHYTRGEILFQAIKEYVEKHYPGNPQTPLDIYVGSNPTPPPKEGACPKHGKYDECWRFT